MDAIDSVFDPLREFSKDSVRLVKRCHKPDRKGNPKTFFLKKKFVSCCCFEILIQSYWDLMFSDMAFSRIPLMGVIALPDSAEFTKVAFRTAIGFVVMGFVGFFVKLIFIPINNIIVGSG